MAEVSIPEESSLNTQLIQPKTNYIKAQYDQFVNSDIKGLLSFLRWTNFFCSLGVGLIMFLSLISVILSFDLNKLLLTLYCLLFNGILCTYELHMKKFGERLRRNYGFLFTYVGRAAFVFFIATIMLSLGTFYKILSVVVFFVALLNVIVTVLHPAFRKGSLSLLDDPSVNYTSGDSEIKNYVVSNPELAQKVLQGAAKLSSQ